mmetsp:Transcript_128517/g.333158  ORF Transcript_128517/g.333158 Transcript_128517/m.333158 type:complete len:203 (+) Transcript_128517:327-935(+)
MSGLQMFCFSTTSMLVVPVRSCPCWVPMDCWLRAPSWAAYAADLGLGRPAGSTRPGGSGMPDGICTAWLGWWGGMSKRSTGTCLCAAPCPECVFFDCGVECGTSASNNEIGMPTSAVAAWRGGVLHTDNEGERGCHAAETVMYMGIPASFWSVPSCGASSSTCESVSLHAFVELVMFHRAGMLAQEIDLLVECQGVCGQTTP